MSKPIPMSPEQTNAAREQIIVNTRLTALQAAQDILKVGRIAEVTGTELVEHAKVIEAYILEGIEAIKPKGTLVLQANMPPPGMFKPGK